MKNQEINLMIQEIQDMCDSMNGLYEDENYKNLIAEIEDFVEYLQPLFESNSLSTVSIYEVIDNLEEINKERPHLFNDVSNNIVFKTDKDKVLRTLKVLEHRKKILNALRKLVPVKGDDVNREAFNYIFPKE